MTVIPNEKSAVHVNGHSRGALIELPVIGTIVVLVANLLSRALKSAHEQAITA